MSSQSYHATIESEVPDGLSADQLRERIHRTFELVRTSVEDELNQTGSSRTPDSPFSQPLPESRPAINGSTSNNGRSNGQTASPKQLDYLRDLGARQGWTKAQLDQLAQDRHNVSGVSELKRNQASALIDELAANSRQPSGNGAGRAA